MDKKPELLLPLNNWKSLYQQGEAIKNGDAFYFGLKSNFSMRARAANFSEEELPKLAKFVHDQNKKLYLCTNIIVYDNELDDLEQKIKLAHSCDVDAIICHDLGAIQISKDVGIPFHVSTQANISNIRSAQYYESIGAERIILARELNLEQIKHIVNTSKIPVEAFIHGAMCTAVSGRCYLSAELMNFDQNFSANRGKCVQPCRRYYTFTGEEKEQINYDPQSGMFFNAKDLCMIEHVDKLIESGLESLKVEGRMRDPRYISEVGKCYREAIDSYYSNEYTSEKIECWMKRLNTVFNRGFHTGFYFSKPNIEDIEKKIRGNVSKTKRKSIGKVINFYRKANAVEIELNAGSISVGDRLIFENKADFYHIQEISSIQMEGKKIRKTENASSDRHIIAGIKVEKPVPINSSVFKLESK